MTRFRRFLESEELPTDLSSITKTHIREFILYLQTKAKTPYGEKPLSGATIQGYVRSLKAFFSWAEREGYLVSGQIGRIPIPKANSKVIDTFTPEQLNRLAGICQIANGDGQRNLTILLLLLDTGIRVSELVSIELEDIYLAEGYIKIKVAKGGKERIVPIGSFVQKSLWKYINYFRPRPLTQQINRLFLSNKGLPLTKSGIQQMLRRYGRRSGFNGIRCSPHTFRHTFAKNYLLNGGDLFSLQKILGHTSLASVRLYLNLFANDVKKQHLRFSPVDNLAQKSNFYRLSRHFRLLKSVENQLDG
jgi:integrase/recombinase XerD